MSWFLVEDLFISTRSAEDLAKAKRCAAILYGDQEELTEELIQDVLNELPLETLDSDVMKGKSLADYMVALKLAESKS